MQVLVLSHAYEPMYMCTVRRALRLLWRGKAVSVKDSAAVVHAPGLAMPVPTAIRLLVRVAYARIRQAFKPNRQAIFRRDGHRCQYCGARGSLTIDHVQPRSRGGGDTWENLVAACVACNHKKGDRRPEEANMPLARAPRSPKPMELTHELWSELLGWAS